MSSKKELFNCLTSSELFVGQHVKGLEGDVMHSQDLTDGIGEAAPRGFGHTLHEDDDISGLYATLDSFFQFLSTKEMHFKHKCNAFNIRYSKGHLF